MMMMMNYLLTAHENTPFVCYASHSISQSVELLTVVPDVTLIPLTFIVIEKHMIILFPSIQK